MEGGVHVHVTADYRRELRADFPGVRSELLATVANGRMACLGVRRTCSWKYFVLTTTVE